MNIERRALIWAMIILSLMLLACYLLTDNTRPDPLEVQNRTYHEIRQGIGGGERAELIVRQYQGDRPTVCPIRPSHYRWVTDQFGVRYSPNDGVKRDHIGVDLLGPRRCEILATMAGEVWSVSRNTVDGLIVTVIHSGGWRSRYAHLSTVYVRRGDRVEAGQVIGRQGDTGRTTGEHLHFEIWHEGRPVDPLEVLRITEGEGGRF